MTIDKDIPDEIIKNLAKHGKVTILKESTIRLNKLTRTTIVL